MYESLNVCKNLAIVPENNIYEVNNKFYISYDPF